MSSHNVSIPCLCLCRSQHICAFHRDRKNTQKAAPTTTKRNHGFSVTAKTLYSLKNDQVPSPLLRLPDELLLMILEHTDRIGRLSLALTCQTMAYLLEEDVLMAAVPRSEGKDATNSFLSVLGRDLHMRFWHCEQCVVLHPRSTPERRASSLVVRFRRIKAVFWRQNSIEPSSFTVRFMGTTIFEMPFPMAKAIMGRHFYTNSKGPCRNTIAYSGERHVAYPKLPAVGMMVLRYNFDSRIVMDRLLLKATYIWEMEGYQRLVDQDGNARPQTPNVETQPETLLKDAGFWICKHYNVVAALKDSANPARTSWNGHVQCKYCLTEYLVERDCQGNWTKIQVWHNFGPCHSENEKTWAQMVSHGPPYEFPGSLLIRYSYEWQGPTTPWMAQWYID
jgi:hypothetical protein